MNTPLQILKRAVLYFEKNKIAYCLVGGHAASLYRAQERLTNDVDFALSTDPISQSQVVAEQAIASLGFKAVSGFIPIAAGETRKNSRCLVSAVPHRGALHSIIDILLPHLPWVSQAVQRAAFNKIDLGFKRVPVITPEDLIIAKCYALRNAPDRFQDLDDLKEIFINVKDLDLIYLKIELMHHNLKIPKELKKFTPPALKRLR